MIKDITTQIIAPPHSVQAEEALIGAVLINPECLSEIDMAPEDFYIRRNGWVWKAFLELQAQGACIDILTVQTELERLNRLAEIGGPARLTSLVNQCASSLHAQSYAGIVKEKAKRRHMVDIAQAIASGAYGQVAIDTTIGQALDSLVSLAQRHKGAVHIRELMSQLYDEIEELSRNPRDMIGFPTGLADLDRATSGLCKQNLYLLSGEMGTGKSLLAYQICANIAKLGHPGAVYEMEMPARQIGYRHISARSKVATDTMKRGALEEGEWPAITSAIAWISELPIYVSEATDWTTTSLRADAARLKAMHGIEWVMVDYLMLLQDMPGERDEERTGHISRALKAMAKDLDVIVVAINSMTKEGIDAAMPSNTSQRGSAQVGYDADDVWFLMKHKPEHGNANPNLRTLIPTKARERDRLTIIHLLKLPGLPAFGDAERKLP